MAQHNHATKEKAHHHDHPTPTKSRWGLGHFATSKLQKQAAETPGLTITRDTLLGPKSQYSVEKRVDHDASFNINLAKLCPEGIEHDGNQFSGRELRAFLEFLAHPTEQSIQKGMTGHFNNKSLLTSGKDFAKSFPLMAATPFIGTYKWMTNSPLNDSEGKKKSDALERVHQVMNWMTSHDGKVTVEHHHDHDHDHGHEHGHLCDCHALADEILARHDAFREQKFGAAEPVNCEFPLAMIPGTGIDAQRGFYFDINKDVLFSEFPEGSPKEKLQSLLKSAFEQTGHELNTDENRIYLSADQLYTFTNEIAFHPEAAQLIHSALYEEEEQHALENVAKDIEKLEKTSRLRQLHNATLDPSLQLEALRVATTALTPLINPKLLNALWESYNVHQRELSPLPKIQDEVSQLHNTITQKIAEGDVTAETVQAIIHEFPSTINFLKAWAIESQRPELADVLDHAGIAKIPISENFMEDHHEKALELFRRAQGKGDGAMKDLAKSSVKSAWTVIKDTWGTVSENKSTAYKAIGFSASIFALSHPAVIGPLMQSMQGDQPQTTEVFILGDDGFETVEAEIAPDATFQHADGVKIVDASDVSIEKSDVAICGEGGKVMHYHFSPNGAIPHCYFNDKLKDVTAGMIDTHDVIADTLLVKAGITDQPTASVSHFSEHARSKINDTLNFWLLFNLAQVVAHGAFYYNMGRRGRRHGLAANKGAANLIADFTNSLSSMAKHTPATLPAVGATLAHHYYTGTDILTKAMNAADINASSDVSTVLMSMFIAGGAASLIKRNPQVADEIIKTAQAIELAPDDQKTLERFAKLSESMGYGATIQERVSENLKPVELSMKIAGIKETQTLGEQNIAPLLESLIAYEITLDHAGSKIGLKDDDERIKIRRNLEDLIITLESYAADENFDQKLIEQQLPNIMASQARHTGTHDIYKMLAGENKKPDALRLLGRHGAQEHRRYVYGEVIHNHGQKLENPHIAPDDWAISQTAMRITSVWDDATEVFNWTRGRYSATPDQALTAIKVTGGAWLATSYGADISGNTQALGDFMAGVINLDSILPAVENITSAEINPTAELYSNALTETSSLIGDAVSYTLPSFNFGVYNIYDDIILTDTVGGLFFLNAVGVAGGYYAIDRGYKPIKDIAIEFNPEIAPAVTATVTGLAAYAASSGIDSIFNDAIPNLIPQTVTGALVMANYIIERNSIKAQQAEAEPF